MRILAISNLYPPHHMGGYELGCRDVLEALGARGHTVGVLTSIYGIARRSTEDTIRRWMQDDFAWAQTRPSLRKFLRLAHREWSNRRMLAAACREFQPDIVYVWNLGHVSTALGFYARQIGFKTAYYLSDWWFTPAEEDSWLRFWDARGGLRGAVAAVARPALVAVGLRPARWAQRFTCAQFTSRMLSRGEASRPVDRREVIHWGIDPARFTPAPARLTERPRMLYAGRIVPAKGLHTVIDALARLASAGEPVAPLTVVGPVQDADYLMHIRDTIRAAGLDDVIEFRGSAPRELLPAIYREHDVFVFPSDWDEPFSIALLEALSSGLAVLGTTRGGSAEILRDGENALAFEAGNALACAAQLRRLIADRPLRERLGSAGRATILENFTFEKMVDQIEKSLKREIGPADNQGAIAGHADAGLTGLP
jgi:glycogen(starch) synthase